MAYIDGFVIAVPTANKEKFRQHGETIDQLFRKHGATQVIEAWGEEVPKGETTDFYKAVKAKAEKLLSFLGCFGRIKRREMLGMKRSWPRWKPWATRWKCHLTANA